MRFLVDAMCGKLATYLRMCGHDTAYALDRSVEADDRLLDLAREEGRTLVTRDRQLAARTGDAFLVDSKDVREQLRELAEAGVDLSLADEPARCGQCNAPLERVEGDATTPEYAPDPATEAVWRCPDCGQHFWKGSHWEDVRETLEEV
jgi:uncharacterized protein with PIN domain